MIKNPVDIENLCNCREAREWGKICAHGVAVGLHWLKAQKAETAPAPARSSPVLPAKKTPMLRREAGGEPAELFIILPPNFDQALARGKVMLVLEAKWGGGRCPLNALPKGRAFAFPPQDNAIIDRLETLTNGETPALLQMETKDFAALHSAAGGSREHHARKIQRGHGHKNAAETAAARHAGGERRNRPGVERQTVGDL